MQMLSSFCIVTNKSTPSSQTIEARTKNCNSAITSLKFQISTFAGHQTQQLIPREGNALDLHDFTQPTDDDSSENIITAKVLRNRAKLHR